MPSCSQHDFPSASCTFNIYFNLFSLWLYFFQLISSYSFFFWRFYSCSFACSFIIPGTGIIFQIWAFLFLGSLSFSIYLHCYKGASPVIEFWQDVLLDSYSSIYVHHVPLLMGSQPVFNIFLCLVICSSSFVRMLSRYCPLATRVCQGKLAVVLLSMALAQGWCHLIEWHLFNG